MNIKTKELKEALDILKFIYAMPGSLTGHDTVVFADTHIIADNGVYSLQVPLETGLEGAVSASELHKILTKTKAAEVEIVIEDNEMLIIAGRVRAKITAPERASFLKSRTKVIHLLATELPDLREAVEYCSTTIVKDSLLFSHIQITGDKVYSTDTIRISQYTLPEPVAEDLYISNDILKIIKKKPITGYKIIDDVQYFLLSDGSVLGGSVKVDNFRDLSEFTKATEDHLIELDTDNSVDELTSITAITKDTKKDDQVCILNLNGGVSVTARGSSGVFSINLCDNTTGFEGKCKVNPNHLIDGFKISNRFYWSEEEVLVFEQGAFKQYVTVEILS